MKPQLNIISWTNKGPWGPHLGSVYNERGAVTLCDGLVRFRLFSGTLNGCSCGTWVNVIFVFRWSWRWGYWPTVILLKNGQRAAVVEWMIELINWYPTFHKMYHFNINKFYLSIDLAILKFLLINLIFSFWVIKALVFTFPIFLQTRINRWNNFIASLNFHV